MNGSLAKGSFWRGRRVLVTGHTGFKGSWLCLWLQRLGAQVTGYALAPPTEPSLFEQADVAAGLEDRRGDLGEAAALVAAIEAARPEVVFHLAAQSLVREGYRQPLVTFETNTLGTARLLEGLRGCEALRAVVVVTTDKVYRNREWEWGYRERDELGGQDPYAASKACAELVTAAYRDSFFRGGSAARLASARAGNVIGGGDWARERLLPDVLRALEAGEPVELRSPGAIRPWQHVLEPLAGYLMLAERLCADGGDTFASGWNFGPDEADAWPVAQVVEQLHRLWRADHAWTAAPGEHPHEAHYLKLDSSRARALLGWRPRLALPVALEWVVEWHRGHRDGADLAALTRGQIDRYVALLTGDGLAGDEVAGDPGAAGATDGAD